MAKRKSNIKIKPSRVGSFTAWAKRKGLLNRDGSVGRRAISAGLKSKSSSIRKKANFARNARKWKR